MPAPCVILSLNSGSSSLKFALYQLGDGAERVLATGAIEQIGLTNGHLLIRGHDQSILTETHENFPDHRAQTNHHSRVAWQTNSSSKYPRVDQIMVATATLK